MTVKFKKKNMKHKIKTNLNFPFYFGVLINTKKKNKNNNEGSLILFESFFNENELLFVLYRLNVSIKKLKNEKKASFCMDFVVLFSQK